MILLTSTIGSNDCCQVEERADHVMTLERFKVLQLNGHQFQLLLVAFNLLHLMIPWSDWRE